MARTIRAALRKDKINKAGTCPVALCITINRKRHYHNLGIKVPESAWNGSEAKGSYTNANSINAIIRTEIAQLEQKINLRLLNGEKITLNTVKNLLKKDSGEGSFYDVSKVVLAGITNAGTLRRYEVEEKQLKVYAPTLAFGDVDKVWLNKYNKHLLAKPMDQNTAINAFKWIRKVFNYARDHGETTLYPFAEWKFPKYEQKVKSYLTMSELDEIEKLLHKPIDKTIKKVAAFFLLECYSGFRFSDWSRFEVEKLIEAKSLKLQTQKTGGVVFIPLDSSPRLSAIIDYIQANEIAFDLTGEHTNRILKSIAGMASIEKTVTTHTGRRTFATLLLEKGFSRETVATALGVSMKIVDVYAKMTGQKIKREFDNLGGL